MNSYWHFIVQCTSDEQVAKFLNLESVLFQVLVDIVLSATICGFHNVNELEKVKI